MLFNKKKKKIYIYIYINHKTVYKQQNDKYINGDKIIKIITAFTEIIKLCNATFAPQEKCSF